MQGQKILYRDPRNPLWDSTRPWHAIPRAEQKCKRCYSDMHEQRNCPLTHAFCDACPKKNHHPAVCYATRPQVPAQSGTGQKREAPTNRGAAAATAVGLSVLKTSAWDSAGEEASRQVLEEKVETAIAKLTQKKTEKSDYEKQFDHLNAFMSSSEHDLYDNWLNLAFNREDGPAMDMIMHRVMAGRSRVPDPEDFVAYEHTAGFYVIQVTGVELAKRIFLFSIVALMQFCVVMGITGAAYECGPRYGMSFEDRYCKIVHDGHPHMRVFGLVSSLIVFLLFLWRVGITKAWWFGEFLVKHTFSFERADPVLEIANNVNNRHPMFRFGKTLEVALPKVVRHDVAFHIPALRPRTIYANPFQLLSDWLLWKFLSHDPRSFQLDHQYWRPVPASTIRGVKNLNHVFSADPRSHAHELALIFPNLGPSVEAKLIDSTRFDAFSSLPNIAASKTWDDMCRNVEIAVKTCNWTAENWRVFGPDAPIALTNLLAYRWLSPTFESRRVLRHDHRWAF